MKEKLNKRTYSIACEKSYYIPNTNIKVEEHNPSELEKLWSTIDPLNSF